LEKEIIVMRRGDQCGAKRAEIFERSAGYSELISSLCGQKILIKINTGQYRLADA